MWLQATRELISLFMLACECLSTCTCGGGGGGGRGGGGGGGRGGREGVKVGERGVEREREGVEGGRGGGGYSGCIIICVWVMFKDMEMNM